MTKVAFIGSWGESPKDILSRYKKQTPVKSGIWKTIEGTADLEEADFYIILEDSKLDLKPEKCIYIKREPDFIRPQQQSYKDYYRVHTWDDGHCGITWWLSLSYDELKVLPYPHKTKNASCVSSNKHETRNNFIRAFFKESGDKVDLYGRGHDKTIYGSAYKGAILTNGKCKLEGIEDYAYNLVLENSQQTNYWTEKLADALLAWCLPIYWGAANIHQFFSEEIVKSIAIQASSCPQTILEIIKAPIAPEQIELLKEARHLVLDKYNIWEVVHKLVTE